MRAVEKELEGKECNILTASEPSGKITQHKVPTAPTPHILLKTNCWNVLVLPFILTRVNGESELGFLVLVYIRRILKAHILFNLLIEYSSEIVGKTGVIRVLEG